MKLFVLFDYKNNKNVVSRKKKLNSKKFYGTVTVKFYCL